MRNVDVEPELFDENVCPQCVSVATVIVSK